MTTPSDLLAMLDALVAKLPAGEWSAQSYHDGLSEIDTPSGLIGQLDEPHAEFIVAFKNAYPALRDLLRSAEKGQEWIPVGERLPEFGNLRYLVTDGKVWRTAWFHSVGDRHWWDCHGQQIIVTHWQPLPALPPSPDARQE